MTQKEIDAAAAGPLWGASPRRRLSPQESALVEQELRDSTGSSTSFNQDAFAPDPARFPHAQVESSGSTISARAQQESWAAGVTHWKPSQLDYSKATFDKAEAEMRKIALDFATRAGEPNPNVAIERAAAYLAFLRGEQKP